MLWSMAFTSSPESSQEHSGDWKAAASEEFHGAFTRDTDEPHQEMSYHHRVYNQQEKAQLLKHAAKQDCLGTSPSYWKT